MHSAELMLNWTVEQTLPIFYFKHFEYKFSSADVKATIPFVGTVMVALIYASLFRNNSKIFTYSYII